MADHSNKSGTQASLSGRKRRRVGLVYDERMCKHSTPKGEIHPENPNRIRAVWNTLVSAGIPQRCVVFKAKAVEDKYIAAVHANTHINLIKNVSSKNPASKRNKVAAKYDSIYFNEGSSESAYLAAGSVLEAAEKVAKGELNSAFAIVRPPGHHAEKNEPMGFCLYNNVAIASSFLLNQKKLGINKILIVDWDVHHGNGTQKMFYKDPQVLVFSVHRYDNGSFYPTGDDGSHIMIGEGHGAGYNINVPWENDQCGDADYIAVWDHILIPVAREFEPDIIMISAGFDAAIGDPIGGCCVTPDGYSIMLKKLIDLSRGKTIMALEGGYNLDSLANSVLACVEVLLEGKSIAESSDVYPLKSTWRVIKTVREQLSEYWPILAEKLPRKLTSRVTPKQEDVTKPLSKLDSEDVHVQIKDLKEKLAQQLTANANLVSENLAKDKILSDKVKILADKDRIIADKNKSLSDKDKMLADKDKILADKDKTLSDKDKTLTDKDKILADKDKILADKDKMLSDKDKTLADQDKDLQVLKQKLAISEAKVKKCEVLKRLLKDALAEGPELSEYNQGTLESCLDLQEDSQSCLEYLDHPVTHVRALDFRKMSNNELAKKVRIANDTLLLLEECVRRLHLLDNDVDIYQERIQKLEAKSLKEDAIIKNQVLPVEVLKQHLTSPEAKDLEIEVLKKRLKDSLAREKALEEEKKANEQKHHENWRLLVLKGIPHIVNNVLKSSELNMSVGNLIHHGYHIGHQKAMTSIRSKMLPDLSLEGMEEYDSSVLERFYKICNEFKKTEFDYIKEISALADKPLDVIMKIMPKKTLDLGKMLHFVMTL